MNPIQPKFTPPAIVPQTPAKETTSTSSTKGAEEAERAFDVGSTPTTGATQAAPTTANIARPNYDRIRSLIESGNSQSMSRDQLREHVITGETKNIFGNNASPEMTSAVSEAFQNDPQLSQLLNRLLSKAK